MDSTTSKFNRRTLLQASGAAALSLATNATGTVIHQGKDVSKKRKPIRGRFWVWADVERDAETSDLKKKYAKLKTHGVDGVFLGGGIDEREFDIVRSAGLHLHAWMWTTNRGEMSLRKEHPDWFQVSRSGKSCFDKPPYVDYYRWLSPVVPGVQSYLCDRAAELANHKAIEGVHLDYVRYPDVILPRGLWSKYGLDQSEELPDYDFCYSEHTRAAFKRVSGRDPLEIKDPAHDQEWLHFRYDSVTNLVTKIAAVVHGHDRSLTAAVFPTPSHARKICRQDWDKWPMDAVCPMIYHSFYEKPVQWIGECMIENIQAAKFPVHAGLYMPAFQSPSEFELALEICHKRGAAGVSLFGGLSDPMWAVFEKQIELWKK